MQRVGPGRGQLEVLNEPIVHARRKRRWQPQCVGFAAIQSQLTLDRLTEQAVTFISGPAVCGIVAATGEPIRLIASR